MPDWTKSMQQSYEYYTVEPTTLADVKRLDNVKRAKFTRELDSETLVCDYRRYKLGRRELYKMLSQNNSKWSY